MGVFAHITKGETCMNRILTAFAALLTVGALLCTLASCGSSEGDEAEVFSTEAAVYTTGASAVGTSDEDVLAYFNKLANGIKDQKPAVEYRIEKSIPTDSLRVTKRGAEDAAEPDESLKALNDAAPGVRDLVLEDIKRSGGSIAYGDENEDMLLVTGETWMSRLTPTDIEDALLEEVGDNYYITIRFADLSGAEAQDVLSRAFDLRDKEAILASPELQKVSAYLTLDDYDVVYRGCRITATVDRLTDRITQLRYYKAADVTAYVTGAGTFADYGELSVLLKLEDTVTYDVNWDSGLPVSPLESTTAD